jgi:hypothetical protein
MNQTMNAPPATGEGPIGAHPVTLASPLAQDLSPWAPVAPPNGLA